MSSPAPAPSRRGPLLLAGLLLLAVGAAAAFVLLRPRPPGQARDPEAAAAANARGVAWMDWQKKEEFIKAAAEFESAAAADPTWLVPRINLGIALFNQNEPEPIARGAEVLRRVLADHPDDRHAHYCLGVILSQQGRPAEAYEHFAAVNRQDPADPHTWVRLGETHPDGPRSPAAAKCFEQALQLDPHLRGAVYNLIGATADTDPARSQKAMDEFNALIRADRFNESEIRYGVMGKYADAIGRDPTWPPTPAGPLPLFTAPDGFKVTLAGGTRWATAADLPPAVRAARERFGGGLVLCDFDRDGRPDLFLPAAVVESGRLRDLLLHNDGGWAFTDVTAAAGLAGPRPSVGAAAADYDNDGRPDLAVTTADGVRLFRNAGDGTFADVTTAAGFHTLRGVCVGCGWIDIDQDGDLDLVVCRYADATTDFTPSAGGVVVTFENVGVPPPAPPGLPPPGLSTAFRWNDAVQKAVPAGSPVAVVFTDLDADQDVDVLVLPDRADPAAVENDRLMRFHPMTAPWLANRLRRWNGGLVLDANHDERSDLFLAAAGEPPTYLLSKGEKGFAEGVTNSPPLRQAVTADVDADGWPDVVGLAADGKPVLLHNRGDGRLEVASDGFGPLPAAVAVACADLDGDGAADLVLWTDAGLQARRNGGNGHHTLLVDPTGRRDVGEAMRTANDALGTRLSAQAARHWAGAERTTLSTGPGQSLLPTALGLGKAAQADNVRLRWPDLVFQAELGVKAGGVVRIPETQRKGTSCPVLLVWDGERFAFVTDMLGGGALGESGPDGSVRPPRGEESVLIEPGRLLPKDGQLLLKLAEPMDEVMYLDAVRLDAVDHPAGVRVVPDERFVFAGPPPTQELLAFRSQHLPTRATDHRGRDVTGFVRERDRRAPPFLCRSWLGYAEEHAVTLEFDKLPAGKRWCLVIDGWTEYPYPESMYAATRAGVPLLPPVLERRRPDGTWEPLGELGFPAGLPRTMTRELPAGFDPSAGCALRLRTNMQVFWDRIALAPADAADVRVTELPPARADLAARGFMQEVLPGGRPPVAYDDAKTEPVAVTAWAGRLTRLGEVTELLRAADDRFVLCGPGDEVTVGFDAGRLPPLPAGWVRSFVLRAHGYCKDTSPTTVTGGRVGPLPFRDMKNYPEFGRTPPATDADHWHTRPAGGR
jgi:tetratricopeptide (TPR) repeat protein